MPIAQSSKSAFDFANRPNYCLYDVAASATLALGTWNELSELLFGKLGGALLGSEAAQYMGAPIDLAEDIGGMRSGI